MPLPPAVEPTSDSSSFIGLLFCHATYANYTASSNPTSLIPEPKLISQTDDSSPLLLSYVKKDSSLIEA